MAHEPMIEHFSGAGAVLPMKLFTLFASDERAMANIRDPASGSAAPSSGWSGRVEWGVRICLDDVRAREVLAAEARESGAQSSGKAFLLRKKREQDAARELAGRLRVEMDDTFDELAAGAAEAVRREPAAAPESGGPAAARRRLPGAGPGRRRVRGDRRAVRLAPRGLGLRRHPDRPLAALQLHRGGPLGGRTERASGAARAPRTSPCSTRSTTCSTKGWCSPATWSSGWPAWT